MIDVTSAARRSPTTRASLSCPVTVQASSPSRNSAPLQPVAVHVGAAIVHVPERLAGEFSLEASATHVGAAIAHDEVARATVLPVAVAVAALTEHELVAFATAREVDAHVGAVSVRDATAAATDTATATHDGPVSEAAHVACLTVVAVDAHVGGVIEQEPLSCAGSCPKKKCSNALRAGLTTKPANRPLPLTNGL